MINKEALYPLLIYNEPIQYQNIFVHPVRMRNIILFQTLLKSITVRKNSRFHDKKIIKMTYLDFLIYCYGNTEIEKEYDIKELSNYYFYAIKLLQICCKDSVVDIDHTGKIMINGEIITPAAFDDLRRIIIIQNDIDFDIDEFLNYDTEQRLLKAQKDIKQNGFSANIEDYIDSLVIAMNTTEERIMNMTIRKFYRYLKRYQLHENFKIAKAGEYSGMISFKEPIKYWMTSLDEEDKYKHLKADEDKIKSKIS